jgi:branched-chain amino acid transport system substrate-binding protein
MMKKLLAGLVVFFVIFLVTPAGFSQVTKPSSDPIKIGCTLPMTGIASESGKWIKAGYEYWEEDINKKGGLLGRPVKIVIYDDETNPDKAVTYYDRAITVDKVDLIVGGPPGTINVALMPLVEKHQKVFIGSGGILKGFEQGYTYSFASPPLVSDWAYLAFAKPIDDLVPKAEQPKSVAVFTMNNALGVSARGNTMKAMEERGIKVVTEETYNLPLSDATPMIAKAKSKNAEVLCCLSFFDDGIMLMRAAKALNYRPKLIMQLIASKSPAWMKELGEDGNNVIGHACWAPGLPFPGNDSIQEGARKKLGMPDAPDYFGLAYCWIRTLELGVRGAGSLDNKKIRDYLRSNPLDLPYGKGIRFNAQGLPPLYAFTIQTTGGQNKLVWPKEVATTKFVYPRPAWSK